MIDDIIRTEEDTPSIVWVECAGCHKREPVSEMEAARRQVYQMPYCGRCRRRI